MKTMKSIKTAEVILVVKLIMRQMIDKSKSYFAICN